MNPGLVACMSASILVGGTIAGLLLATGAGWMLAFLGYSLGGSTALVASTLLMRPGEPRPAPLRLLPPPHRMPVPA